MSNMLDRMLLRDLAMRRGWLQAVSFCAAARPFGANTTAGHPGLLRRRCYFFFSLPHPTFLPLSIPNSQTPPSFGPVVHSPHHIL